MIKLNDNNIIVGQIKQILHTFNLPQCAVGSAYPKEGSHYLTKNHIMRWERDGGNLIPVPCERYVYGDEYINLTTTLPINNMLYDVETHQYLGRYLRFLRDYNDINLMSMYNCWDGSLNSDAFELILGEGSSQTKISFKSGDDDSLVYKVPISVSDFTLAVHGAVAAQICVYADINKSDSVASERINEIARATYRKRRMQGAFSYSPFSEIVDDELSSLIAQNRERLYLLIKVPRNLNTSIVVLEGNYANDLAKLNSSFKYKPTILCDVAESADLEISLLAKVEKSVRDAQTDSVYNLSDDPYIAVSDAVALTDTARHTLADTRSSRPYEICAQLLSRNNISSKYLLADRLIEYLTGNAISKLSQDFEIARVQRALNLLRGANNLDQLQDPTIAKCRYAYKNVISSSSDIRNRGDRYIGIWHPLDLEDLRSIATKSGISSSSYDCIGYLDKDLESVLKGVLDYVEV